MDNKRTCGQCAHWKLECADLSLGECAATVPEWVNYLIDCSEVFGYELRHRDSTLAEACKCFFLKEDPQ